MWPDSVLADMYLQEILNNLWKHWEHREPAPNQPLNTNAGEATRPAQSDFLTDNQTKKRFQPLHVPELKMLVQNHDIPVPKGKKATTKDDLINAIITSSVNISQEEIEEILKGRKEKPKASARK
ncbi:hypothetical protein Clacol_004952 [Clathrus columnatus]|uniref:Rho termination factor N-terminal domain-containing protein n=1 Tax=Clathrus columnatus TaxID=1419009 RepID=A0AAV5A8U3_9AGAM|nr:hypothetical protein Clacol_004952 [Clathrus columnatus]